MGVACSGGVGNGVGRYSDHDRLSLGFRLCLARSGPTLNKLTQSFARNLHLALRGEYSLNPAIAAPLPPPPQYKVTVRFKLRARFVFGYFVEDSFELFVHVRLPIQDRSKINQLSLFKLTSKKTGPGRRT